MIFGVLLTSVTFVFLVISIVAYYLYHLKNEEQVLKLARSSFYAASGLILFQSAMLMYGILNHYFEWIYVFSYSSKDLPLHYLISVFWAGQEGTFLLWLLFGSAYGIYIIKNSKEDEPLVMSFMSLIQAFIVFILINKSPFAYVWEVNPLGFEFNRIPIDGNGLNPLLQDPWMVIHPPILFSGYSSSMIMFAFAMSALIRNKHDDWIRNAFPYTLFVSLSLGAGIILGGYWAYTTLGWGGYWGWDPVENSSLIPWLLSLALIHGMLVQRRTQGMKRLNLFLAIATFVTVLYGSFLTRSGVLTDFSVHSFGESEVAGILASFVLLFAGIGLLTFLFRVKGVKGSNVSSELFTRELFISFGILIILILTVITFVGTSWPLITSMFNEKGSSVEPAAYNAIGGPIAILMGILIALSPVLSWKRNNPEKLKNVLVHFVITIVSTVVISFFAIKEVIPLVVISAGIFIVLINGQIVYQMVSKKSFAFGGYLAHVGLGLMFVGIITSEVYDKEQRTTLPLDETVHVLGYDLQYKGKKSEENGKDKVLLTINNNESAFARFYWSEYNQGYMVAPSVKNTLFEDLYISPIQIIPPEENIHIDDVKIAKSETADFENVKIRFNDYNDNNHQAGGSEITLYADIDIMDKDGKVIESLKPGIKVKGGEREELPATFMGTERLVYIKGLSVDDNKIILSITGDHVHSGEGRELLAVEVSVKPFINVLWLGTVILLLGFSTSIYNRSRRQKL